MAKVKAKSKKAPAKKAAAPKKVAALAPGMQWVNPYLTVKDPGAEIAFLEKAFGFTVRFAMKGPDGRVQHAEVAHKSGVIMFGPENPQYGGKAPLSIGGTPVAIYVYVEDVDALAARAQAAGGRLVDPPKDQFYGDRTARIDDPEGHVWYFATHIKDVAPEDMHP